MRDIHSLPWAFGLPYLPQHALSDNLGLDVLAKGMSILVEKVFKIQDHEQYCKDDKHNLPEAFVSQDNR